MTNTLMWLPIAALTLIIALLTGDLATRSPAGMCAAVLLCGLPMAVPWFQILSARRQMLSHHLQANSWLRRLLARRVMPALIAVVAGGLSALLFLGSLSLLNHSMGTMAAAAWLCVPTLALFLMRRFALRLIRPAMKAATWTWVNAILRLKIGAVVGGGLAFLVLLSDALSTTALIPTPPAARGDDGAADLITQLARVVSDAHAGLEATAIPRAWAAVLFSLLMTGMALPALMGIHLLLLAGQGLLHRRTARTPTTDTTEAAHETT